ncbi:heterokaryon incompatibility protein-domain-containing protein [Cadophora sp. MPI-SDFR-AT-0126]|nr:heterokaryon incompatibility protein-domain-containing protein [Leotiomycetes sp. MPI-SDFR-AT-0126]
MRLLEYDNDGESRLTEFFDNIPPYAILSHTWGLEEVNFKDIIERTGTSKAGFDKIQFCGEQARRDGLHYFWVDTCCIDKSSSAELAEAINSMFRWYRDAAKCYVFLSDVPRPTVDGGDRSHQFPWEPAIRRSKWFTRGWTLQELIAPKSVEFYSKDREFLGDKKSLERHICEVTGIPSKALRGSPLANFSVAERMSWIEARQTTRKEDMAYSLLGIFDVSMPLIYGEGRENAFKRVREEINKNSKGFDQELQGTQHIIVCYKCGEDGHYANDPHCFKCGEYGHYANDPHCYKCGEYGHYANDPHCYKCDRRGHFAYACQI